MVSFTPHTLVRLKAADALTAASPLPDWAVAILTESPYVIVRRGPQADRIPVGLRGYQKAQRFAAFVVSAQVAATVTPQQALALLPQLDPMRAQLPAFQKLKALQPLLQGFDWGVGGSLQFELVTGLKMARPVSDVDVIMTRPAQALPVAAAQTLIQRLQAIAGAHADIQVVHGQAGFSLEEYAQHRAAQVMMKTATGPQLTADPWHFEGES
ncbi:MAG: malonate decarboxylase holo-ACP synthase [Lactobacillus sp.]|jgi:phosphoribosyl-dephospho-CoA transferase|uniref:Malonate decarboxylase holo-ACP synthase n=1 Tax=Lacticaseibacillus suilingensis TaxID=2799577 RepID=A0ABW4BFZ5_9LACO|nr:malonate decarboxylase holo-ACP synthase [Lacticaseibacillus suilingensis]MCI1894658.1 malonate decarboxylase holo-ACP synthase [Lactobacillus sp.]MCI1918315.1 malonate decarboxylase holo-ACP synthase [Lactobacillus sp.]MCI1942312.1 malonate decarboxylase holo-ACP synthase [Lactobacillus sp.]MCI1972748.1 malonate decarboxylase holo-ACP synthase [Lactobacillus sp.]MCI2016553.1 malonate decarboxylase holo-ACP synthase [Lactobacillus sp.]